MNSYKKNLLNKKIEKLEESVSSDAKSKLEATEKAISALVEKNELEEAEKKIASVKLSESWCHKAVTVYVLRKKYELAKKVINWAKETSNKLYVWRLCIYEYAKTRWQNIWGHGPEGIIVLPG